MMTRNIICFTLLLFVSISLQANYNVLSLLLNNDFQNYDTHSRNFPSWHCFEPTDTRRDLQPPKKITGGTLFQKPTEGLLQAIYFSHQLRKKVTTSPLLLSFEYRLILPELLLQQDQQKPTTSPNAQGVAYLNIKYTDGTILPVHLFADELTTFDNPQTFSKCVVIPNYGKDIENIMVGVGSFGIENRATEEEGLFVYKVDLQYIDKDEDDSTEAGQLEPLDYQKHFSCSKVLNRKPLNYKTEPNFFVSHYRPDPLTDLTIVTQLTIDRLEYLQRIVHTYRYGPVSAAVFIKNHNEFLKIQDMWMKDAIMRNTTTIHLVYQTCKEDDEEQSDNPNKVNQLSFSYPVNFMRNLARKYSETLYILYIDADFLVPQDFYHRVAHGRVYRMMTQLNQVYVENGQLAVEPNSLKMVIVLPAYQTHAMDKIPKSRSHLLQLNKETEGRVGRIPYGSQSYVNFDEWEKPITDDDGDSFDDSGQLNAADFYHINWDHMLHFEPYFIQPRSTPLFSERFTGGARDKLQQTLTTHLAGYRFVVWRKQFICHTPHPKGVDLLMSGGWPPKRHTYLTVTGHYWMMFKEFYDVGKMDFDPASFDHLFDRLYYTVKESTDDVADMLAVTRPGGLTSNYYYAKTRPTIMATPAAAHAAWRKLVDLYAAEHDKTSSDDNKLFTQQQQEGEYTADEGSFPVPLWLAVGVVCFVVVALIYFKCLSRDRNMAGGSKRYRLSE